MKHLLRTLIERSRRSGKSGPATLTELMSLTHIGSATLAAQYYWLLLIVLPVVLLGMITSPAVVEAWQGCAKFRFWLVLTLLCSYFAGLVIGLAIGFGHKDGVLHGLMVFFWMITAGLGQVKLYRCLKPYLDWI